ncbi:M20/M25/M40 family metallo-hydrolase [Pontibacter sp. MBLB2868]|uniref:M20/M25/M40 family metallo-hydrolase n=1 Tax=Pontibacter sp. MBLB2868 TaxID=3451555 RepID=UPI003F74B23F
MQFRHRAIAVFVLVAVTSLALLSIYLLQPPAPKPANAPVTAFSATRAMEHVQHIAGKPHAMGTAEHAKVRTYLLQEMQKLGLDPQVQEAAAVNDMNGVAYVGHVYNLIGRLRGTGKKGKAILLMAHYDSQPNARGAGDDASGVAAILETIRALKQNGTPAHDVIVLLTDGEEYGLYGAKAFMKHPWAKQVALVLNVEARGNAGPSMTFELSPENGWVAKQYIREAPYPFVSSLAYEIYKRMPNDTDFTVFKDAGYSGLNSAFIDGFVHYHKATDSPENLDIRSLQQHGSNMLALTKHFANIPLSQTKAPDSVFFNFIGSWVINYPQELNVLWVALITLLLLVTVKVSRQKGGLTIRQVLISFFVYVVVLVLVVVMIMLINNLVLAELPFSHRSNGVYSAHEFFIAYLLLALGFFLLLSWFVLRWLRLLALFMGLILVQFVLMMVLFLIIPNATYLLLFPLLFSMGGLLLVLLLGLHEVPRVDLRYTLVMLFASVPAIFLLMPIVQVVFVAFGLQLPAGPIALFVLLLGLLLPLLWIVEQSLGWRQVPVLPLVLLLLGGIQTYRAVGHEKPSEERPLHSHISYYLNADTGKAQWATYYQTTDDWNRQFFTEASRKTLSDMYPQATLEYLVSDARSIDVPAPVAEVVSDTIIANERVLQLRLASRRDAAHLELVLQPKDTASLHEVKLAGEELDLKPLDTKEGKVYYVRLHGLPVNKQVELELHLAPDTPLTLHLYDQSIGLPQELVKKPKPAHVIAEQGGTSNITVVRKSYSF